MTTTGGRLRSSELPQPGAEQMHSVMGRRALDAAFWDDPDPDQPQAQPENIEDFNNKQSIDIQEKSKKAPETFYKKEDVSYIEKFFKKIVNDNTALYDGDWKVTNDVDLQNMDGVLSQAFGTEPNDEDGTLTASASSGKVRSFVSRQNTSKTINLMDLFGDDEKEEKAEDEAAAGELKKFTTAFHAELIMFQGQFREREIDIQFLIHPATTAIESLTYSKTLNGEPYVPDASKNQTEPEGVIETLTIKHMLIGIFQKKNFQSMNETTSLVDMTIQDCKNEPFEGTCVEISIERIKEPRIDENGNEIEISDWFPSKIEFRLVQGSLQSYMANVSNYSFMVTMVIILSFFTMLGVIKQVTENHALAQSLSPISVGINLIWNLFFFAINFQMSMYGEGQFLQYLGLPAFWYFISSFSFEMRLFILVWRASLDQRQMFDEQYLRKRLTWFYIIGYVTVFTAVIFQNILLYETWAILLFNSSLWIPQIIHSYVMRSRKGPSMQFACAAIAMQSFMPLYLKIDPRNFLDHETDAFAATIILLFIALQLFIIKRQQTHGARWFVPKQWRRNPFAHDYYQNTPASVLRRAKACKDPTEQSGHEDDITCVICMNYVHFEVDEHGGLIQTNAPVGVQPAPITNQQQENGTSYLARLQELIGRVVQGRRQSPQVNQELTSIHPVSRSDGSTESTVNDTQLISQTEDNEIQLDDEEAQPERKDEVATTTATTNNNEPAAIYKLCKKFMKTPCNHSYHTVCLKKWMDIRLECPTCRQAIPQPDDD